MSKKSDYVFLMDCADINEVQVVKSYLTAMGFHPRVKDEYTRTVAPHYTNLLGRLSIEVPEDEIFEASKAIEERNDSMVQVKEVIVNEYTPDAKRALFLAILGCVLIPVIANIYSMYIGFKVMRKERPLSRTSRNQLFLAIIFNSVAFYFWLTVGMPILKGFTNILLK